MTIAQQIVFAKRKGRVSGNVTTDTYTDDVTRFYINEGVREFCKKTKGISSEEFLTVTPTFNTRTNFAIRLTITGGSNALSATDIAITATAYDRTTGTQVASDLQTAIQAAGAASATVSWSTTAWTFTIDASDSTSITIEAPDGITYVDATDMLFGKSGTQVSTTWVSGFPQDCTVRASLPSDFLSIEQVEWDKCMLQNAPYMNMMSPEMYGDPTHYHIKDKYIYFTPVPNMQKELKIEYQAFPASATLTGSLDTSSCPLAQEYHMAPVYYAASKHLEDSFEYQESIFCKSMFDDECRKYKMNEANQNPKMIPRQAPYKQPQWVDERG